MSRKTHLAVFMPRLVALPSGVERQAAFPQMCPSLARCQLCDDRPGPTVHAQLGPRWLNRL